MKRCMKCITPDTVPGVVLDEAGVCGGCRSHQALPPPDDGAFRALIDSNRGKSRKYDAVVPLSGGRDSSFVLYLAKIKLGLRVLAVNFDNEFQTKQASANVERACRRLDVDLEKVRSRTDVARRLVRASIRSSMPLGLYGVVGKLCRACSYGYHAAVYRAAERHQVPLILWGVSRSEDTKGVQETAFQTRRVSPYAKLLRPSFYAAEWLAYVQRRELPVPGNSLLNRRDPKLMNPNIREVFVFDHVKWERQEIKETIARELGWEKPADHSSTWRIDCDLHPLINHCFVKMMGCTKHALGYSIMIREGQMTRAEALAHEVDEVAKRDHGIYELLVDRIGLRPREAQEILAFQ